ncbi:hypothetical protein Tco_0910923 [Tanacetum coccineum]|uniref:Uncharacterized protein n=1 Tax=Tanacetum coccineum TaxID=301880 RepID=A0ABQ5CWG3_9ASTR
MGMCFSGQCPIVSQAGVCSKAVCFESTSSAFSSDVFTLIVASLNSNRLRSSKFLQHFLVPRIILVLQEPLHSVLGWAYAFHQDKASSVRFPVFATRVPVGPVFLLGLLVPAIVTAYASRVAVTLSATSFLMAACASDVDILLGGILST